MRVAALQYAVGLILLACTKKKMVNIHAGWGIAFVADHQAIRDIATLCHPRVSVSRYTSLAKPESSIAVMALLP